MQTPPLILKFQTVHFSTSIKEILNEQRLSQRLDSSSNHLKSCPKEEPLNTEVQANHYEAHAALRLRNAILRNSTVQRKRKVLSSVTEARLAALEHN